MKKKFIFGSALVALLCSGIVFTSCKDDDDDNLIKTRTITVKNVVAEKDFVQSGTFAAVAVGGQTQITFHAGKGQTLAFAAMYGNSKDLFFAPVNPGIKLFNDDGTAVTGDVSAQVKLWDNGTLVNSDPAGTASSQPTTAEDKLIVEIAGTDGTYIYPAANEMMKLNLAYNATTSLFTLTISNNSDDTDVQTAFSAGVWAVSNRQDGELLNTAPFYTAARKTTTELTALATAGNTAPFVTMLDGETGIMTGISPVLVVVYTGDTNPIFQVNAKDGGIGLKKLAQTGDASDLRTALERERLVTRVYVFGNGTAVSGEEFKGQYEAYEYEKVAFVTMFTSSNDWFYANNTSINGQSTGDKTNLVSLYDDGTAVSQYPGAGNAQVGFNNSPIAEDVVIKVVDATSYPAFPVPSVAEVLKVTID